MTMLFLVAADMLAHAVKNNDGVVYGIAENREKRGHKKRIYFRVNEDTAEECEKACRDDNIVREGDERNRAIVPSRRSRGTPVFFSAPPERKHDEERYPGEYQQNRVPRFTAELLAY